MIVIPDNGVPSAPPTALFPLALTVSVPQYLFGGVPLSLTLHTGLTVLLGPNGTGKTQVMRSIRSHLQTTLSSSPSMVGRRPIARLLAAGRSAPFERFRGPSDNPSALQGQTAAVGHRMFVDNWHQFESIVGDVIELHARADLRIKVEARLSALLQRRLRFQWTQDGLELRFVSSQGSYSASAEASGVLHLVGLLAAIHNDKINALLIDEPEVSLHPQFQAFLLEEARSVAGDPLIDPRKKLVVISTHAQAMLPLRRITDLPNLIFFTNSRMAPRQIPPNVGELKRRTLGALVARLSEGHRAAFFASTVLLVEGPSDEIIVSALANSLGRSVAGAGSQVVPVIGKGEMPETARLFRLMGKRIVVLADLDALTDSNALVGSFAEEDGAKQAAINAGHSALLSMDGPVRSDFALAITDRWTEVEHLAAAHRYMMDRGDTPLDTAKRRAALATVLSADEAVLGGLPHGDQWMALRSRFRALLAALEAGGCFLLRRGTIEDCYLKNATPGKTGKPEAAAEEAATFSESGEELLRQNYADVVRAIECAAPPPPIDENELLRIHLAGLLATTFQAMKTNTSQEDLNAIAEANSPDAIGIYKIENVSADHGGKLALRVSIKSPLFARSTFPYVVIREQNLSTEVERMLPPSQPN